MARSIDRRRRRFLAACLIGGLGAVWRGAAWAASRPAPNLPLAEAYRADIDPAAFWISEKFDGVRAVWDGAELRFRSGRRVPAPDWFLASLPAEPLDGELWLGRGGFDELSAIVRKAQAADEAWRGVTYLVFELPNGEGDFTARIERLRTVVAGAQAGWLRAVEQFRVADRVELKQRFDDIVAGGGEGLMLHRADAAYHTGRSGDLLKLKPAPDAEAVVVGYERGRGRLADGIGALRLRMPNGKEFRLGSGLSDALRRQPPPIGSTATYRYQELTRDGLPRFPRFLREFRDF